MSPSLNDMIGSEIAVRIPFLNSEKHVNVILESVEDAGIWINSRQTNDDILLPIGVKTNLRSFSVFVPFAKIDFVLGVSQLPYLSEQSLGLSHP